MISSSQLPKREEYLKKKRKRKLIQWGIILSLFILIVGVSSFILHRSQFRISKVILSGGILVGQTEVSEKTLNYISGSYLWLFPKNVFFLYPKKDLENYLAENFKRIESIKIHTKGLQTMEVEITERKPFAIWCDTLPLQKNIQNRAQSSTTIQTTENSTSEHCYFMDQNSRIFAVAPDFSGDAYFKYYGQVSTSTPIGTEFMASTTEFSEISDFVKSVKKLSISPLYIIAKENNEFALVLSNGTQIYFDIKEPLSKVVTNLTALLHTSEFSSVNLQNLPVDYIDMRFGNKLFYKLK